MCETNKKAPGRVIIALLKHKQISFLAKDEYKALYPLN